MKAKFKCVSKTGIETFTVNLEPVEDGCWACGKPREEHVAELEPEAPTPTTACGGLSANFRAKDTTFFASLPHAQIFLSVLTPEAAAQFEPGKITEVDFTLAG